MEKYILGFKEYLLKMGFSDDAAFLGSILTFLFFLTSAITVVFGGGSYILQTEHHDMNLKAALIYSKNSPHPRVGDELEL